MFKRECEEINMPCDCIEPFNIESCNIEYFDCRESCCGESCCCEPCDCKEYCCKVLKSIALIETSIAHILNAEGEKIQQAITATDDICKIIKVNESVRKTIEKVTRLEFALLDKIDALKEWCICCDEECCPCTDDECQHDSSNAE